MEVQHLVLSLVAANPPGVGGVLGPEAAGLGLLLTALVLGVRHGIDLDHIAATRDLSAQLRTMTASALFLHGRSDPRPAATELIDALPNSSLVLIPDAGHLQDRQLLTVALTLGSQASQPNSRRW